MIKFKLAIAAICLASSTAFAGPFILAGTDADDHGSVSAGVNQDGWFFMQRSLENIGAGVTNSNKTVTILGSTGSAATAANSAFNLSSLASTGWTVNTVSIGNFATFFGSGGGIDNAGILMMDSGNNISGGVSGTNFTAFASTINSFVGSGGGLFSQANGYAWLTALLPAVTVTVQQNSGLALTAAGSAAFPGLTNSDLSAGPWHNWFNNFDPIPVLATGTGSQSQRAAIIGGTGGSITDPGNPIPEPGVFALMGLGLAGLAATRRRKQAA